MLISNMDPDILTRDQSTKVVFGLEGEKDDGTLNEDVIFVFGGICLDRVEKAVELYNNQRDNHTKENVIAG
jgi:hypothetical protein